MTVWKRFWPAFGFSLAKKYYFLAKNLWLKSVPKRIKKHIKNAHRRALNSKQFLGGYPPNKRENNPPSSALPPLMPSALDDFLRQSTFKYTATALRKGGKGNEAWHFISYLLADDSKWKFTEMGIVYSVEIFSSPEPSLRGELLVYQWLWRSSSVNIFKHLLLWNRWAN